MPEQGSQHKWSIVDAKTGTLFVLSLLLTQAVSRTPNSWLDPFPYVSHVNTPILASGLRSDSSPYTGDGAQGRLWRIAGIGTQTS